MSSVFFSQRDPLIDEVQKLAEGTVLLYVEDEEAVRNEMTEILSMVFPKIVTARNGKEGLERFHEAIFAVVITDLHMPEMNGVELIRAIQEIKPHQSFLVTSAYSEASQLIPLINLGVGNFVLKPLDWRMLLAMLRKELAFVHNQELETRHQRHLEREVRLRTQELQEAQLQIVKLEEAKANMLALIGHELRTPLNGILGFIDMLRPYLQVEEARVFLDFVDQSAKRLERSTRKALDFAGISTESRSLKYEPLQLEELVSNAQDLVLVQYEDSAKPTPVRVEGTLKTFFSDGEFVQEALRNLFENAWKYAGPQADVFVRLDREGKWAVLSVQDDGPGFTDAALRNLFQPFMSGDLMHHSEGIGLGLSLVDVILLSLGGKVQADNRPEGGARIRLFLPENFSGRD